MTGHSIASCDSPSPHLPHLPLTKWTEHTSPAAAAGSPSPPEPLPQNTRTLQRAYRCTECKSSSAARRRAPKKEENIWKKETSSALGCETARQVAQRAHYQRSRHLADGPELTAPFQQRPHRSACPCSDSSSDGTLHLALRRLSKRRARHPSSAERHWLDPKDEALSDTKQQRPA